MSIVGDAHSRLVLPRRFQRLCELLAPLLPEDGTVLDIGTGSGQLARSLMDRRPDCRIDGIDVLVRDDAAIPVREFDGFHVPAPDKSRDAVLFVDVLHHTNDPALLLREAARVARSAVIVKDHLREGIAAELTLRLMDWAGNAHHGVRLPYSYWSKRQWDEGLRAAALTPTRWETQLALYPAPVSWICDRRLHVIAVLEPRRRS